MKNSIFLKAFEGKTARPPVWLMRQAGRYLPEYRKIRTKYSFLEMTNNPDIVAEVTALPVKILNVDAAILFADILTLPMGMGFDIDFIDGHGPCVNNPITTGSDIDHIHAFDRSDALKESIASALKALPADMPLIGFAGTPFTVLTYLLGGPSPKNMGKITTFLYNYENEYRRLMEILTDNTIEYFKIQKQAGIDAFQLFDSWGGLLSEKDFAHYIFPYNKRIFEHIDLPSIYYLRNSAHLVSWMTRTPADFLSVCHTVDFSHKGLFADTGQGVQGNLFNGYLYADYEKLEKELMRILDAACRFERYIFNLNHGLLPDMDLDKVKFIVDRVRNYSPLNTRKPKSSRAP